MSEVNPYAPPQADLTPLAGPDSKPLASPWIRLVAQIIDGIISGVIIASLMFISGYYSRVASAAAAGETLLLENLIWAPVQLAIMLGINWTFLLQGQTIGKKIMKVRIVRKNGDPIDRTRIITHRLVPVWLLGNIPFINLLLIVDALCIFRAGRNTIHDDIADTKVVEA